jgi:uncharacterized protein (TIGR03083 family)
VSLPEPIHVVHLFPDERSELLSVLRLLADEQWRAPTVCAGWSVKDVAQHLLGDDIGRLSGGRDGHRSGWLEPGGDDFEARLLAFINERNEAWVSETRRLSPRVIIDLLEWSGRETQDYFEMIDPEAPSLGVSWAGEATSPAWFDLAREYTERWHHQAQIREGADVPLLTEPRLFAPVLATFVRGVPHSMRSVEADEGTRLRFGITGPAGGAWDVVRGGDRWELWQAEGGPSDAVVELDEDTAWRTFTKGLSPDGVRARAKVSGDARLLAAALRTVSIIA